MPPPPPPLSQPLPFHFKGQQSGDVSFTASAEAAANTSSGENPAFSAPDGLPALSAPPIPPPTFNPYHASFHSPFHMYPYYGSSPMPRSYGSVPPFGSGFGPNFVHRGYSHSPQFAPLRPNPVPGYPYRSPMIYPHHHYWGHLSPAPTSNNPGQVPQFAPPFRPPPRVPPYHLMQPLPPFPHPQFGHPSSFPPAANLNISLGDGSEMGKLRPSTLIPPHAHLHAGHFSMDDYLSFHSPSGITAASLQVHPPSSPPSAPSLNLQPSSTNQNNCNATSTAMPNLGTTEPSTGIASSILNPTNYVGGTALQYSSFPPAGGTVGASPLAHALSTTSVLMTGGGVVQATPGSFSTAAQPSSLTQVSAAARGVATSTAAVSTAALAEEQGAEGGRHQPELEEEGSVSSLPVSIPEELRYSVDHIVEVYIDGSDL